MTDPRRRIPPLDRLLEAEAFRALRDRYPGERVARALRRAADAVRTDLSRGDSPTAARDLEDPEVWARRTRDVLEEEDRPSLRRVINATGVILHTNLGRAPLSSAARDAMERAGSGYGNLEFDLESGQRGSRYVHCTSLVRELTGGEDALVVNNNAAALVLAVNTLARGRGVLVSRGELVEIGGGFRIPEMLERSGARLVEVGSTNRTRLEDYRHGAAGTDAALLLKVHRSNFRITGFTEETSLGELAGLAAELEVPLVHDLGSGLLADPAPLGLPDEPTPSTSLAEGAHLVAFSGDKLLGGPQAGILAGRAALMARLRANPLCRALRVDKVTLAALEATLASYRSPETAMAELPTLEMLARTPEVLEGRARGLAARWTEAGVTAEAVASTAVVGGGTFPGTRLPSWAVALRPAGPGSGGGAQALAAALRRGDPPVVGRIEDDTVLLDLRTVDPAEEEVLSTRVAAAVLSTRVADAALSTRVADAAHTRPSRG